MLNGNTFKGTFKFPSISLDKPGNYRLDFYYYMYCNQAECEKSGDSIRILINQDIENSFSKIILLKDIKKERVWIKDSINYYTNQNNLKVKIYLNIIT